MDPFNAVYSAAKRRYERFHAGDLNAVSGPEVAEQARELLRLSQIETPEGPGLVIPGVQLAATLFWSRCVAAEQAGHAADRDDEAALWTLVDTLRDIDPALVPFTVPEQRPVDHWELLTAGQQVLNQATATIPFDQNGVRQAADLLHQAVTLAQGTPDHPVVLGSLGATMIDVYQCSGDPQDLDTALAAIREALTTLPPEHPMRLHLRAGLGGALVRRYEHSRDLANLAEAEALLRAVLPAYPPDADPTPSYADLASVLNARAMATGDPADVEAAIVAVRDAVARMPVRHPSYPGFTLMLGRLLDRLGDSSTVDERVAAFRAGLSPESVAELKRTKPEQLVSDLLALAAALMARIDLADELTAALAEELDECVALTRTAAELMPDSPFTLRTLGLALRVRWARVTVQLAHEETRSARGFRGERAEFADPDEDLREAISMFTASLAHGGGQDVEVLLGTSWKLRYDSTGDLADLDRAIDALARHETDLDAVVTYGTSLAERFKRTGEQSDVDTAVKVLGGVAATREPGDHQWLAATRGYADACSARAERTGDLADADAAIAAYRSVLSALANDDDERGHVLWRLGVAYWHRYNVLTDLADANRSVDTVRAALMTLAFDDEERTSAVIALGNTLAVRGRHLGSSTDVFEAVRCFQAAVSRARDEPSRHGVKVSLGNALFELATMNGQPDHYELAEATFRELLAPEVATRRRTQAALGLGSLLSMRGGRAGDLAELDEGVTLLRPVIGEAEPGASLNLANALKLRYGLRRDPADLDEAITTLERLALGAAAPQHAVLTLHLADLWSLRGHDDRAYQAYLEVADGGAIHAVYRVFAARSAGGLAARENRWDDAVAAYTLAIELLPLIAWGGLERADQQRDLFGFAGLAGEAAAVALSAGRPETAVELLEQGRAVLWTRVLQTRGDPAYGSLDGLAPELVAELTSVRAAMQAPSGALPDGGLPAEVVGAHARMVHAHREEELTARVREQPGYENFLRRKEFAELRAAASAGPVVLVNVTARRCDALVVTTAGVRVVELDVPYGEVVDRAVAAMSPRPTDGLASFVDAQASLVDTLAWLWDKVVEPVLAVVPESSRVWWCPAGFASVFPLHVAGQYGGSSPVSAMDRVVSSYTTTLTALTRARQRPAAGGDGRLVVGVADAPDLPRLSNVDDEVRLVGGDTTLVGQAATADRVLAELARHPWAHIACHGYQDFADPSRSYLAMHDRPLTVPEIAALDLPGAELAFLSACETAAAAALPDEAISAAAALQLAGYRHVIATLWPIPDRSTVAEAVYREGGAPADPARALHDAIRAAMAANPYEPTSWAPYQHLGP